MVRKIVPTDSFFTFFKPPQPPTPETLENEDVDEDELEELDTKLETDYQLGEEFKEKIIPRAIDYFTGKALRYEDDFEDEELDDFEDDDDEDDDEDDEDAQVSDLAQRGSPYQSFTCATLSSPFSTPTPSICRPQPTYASLRSVEPWR